METLGKRLLRTLGIVALISVAVGCAPAPTPTPVPPVPTAAPAPVATVATVATAAPTQPAAVPTAAPVATAAPTKPAAVPTAATQELAARQILRFATAEEDASGGFDPIKSTDTPSMDIQKVIYNALVRLKSDAASYEDLEADLATRWESTPDKLAWTFYLRQGVQFQKGFGEVTADDVVFTLNRARVKGASWATTFANIKDVAAVDKYTVKITVSSPDPYFLYKLSNGGDTAAVIVSKKAVEQYGDKFNFNPIGTGPFQFEQYVPKQKVVLLRNENYFRGKPIIERVEYLFVPDFQSQMAALKAGELDIAHGNKDREWVDQLKKLGFKVLNGAPYVLPLAFNLTVKPFDDIRVRQAIRHAIDPKAYVEYYGPDFVFPDKETYSVWPWQMRAYQAAKGQVKTYNYDPQKAKQLLADAGYPNGFSVDLTWTNQARFLVPIQIVQAQVAKVGIKINLTVVEHSVYRNLVDGKTGGGKGQAMAMISISRDTPDAPAREWFHSDSIPPNGKTAKYNYAHYGEALPGVDDLINKAITETDPDKSLQLYVEIQKRVAEDLPVISLSQGVSEPYVYAPYLDLGYEWHSPDRRYPPITEKTRILKH